MTIKAGPTDNSALRRHRRVVMTTCQAHAAAGFTNLLVTKEDGVIVLNARRELLCAATGRAGRNRPAGHPRGVAGVRRQPPCGAGAARRRSSVEGRSDGGGARVHAESSTMRMAASRRIKPDRSRAFAATGQGGLQSSSPKPAEPWREYLQ